MSRISKRRLASLASASALIATVAVAAAPSATLAAPSTTTGRTTSNGYSSIASKVTGKARRRAPICRHEGCALASRPHPENNSCSEKWATKFRRAL